MSSRLQLAIIEGQATIRERELEVGRLVLRAARAGDPFLVRRALKAVGELEAGPARRALRHAVEGLADLSEAGAKNNDAVARGLLGYGAVLERHGVHEGAEEVYRAVLDGSPEDARMMLHVARAARKAGRREEALELYRRAGQQCGSDVHMRLLVGIGEALLAESPEAALTEVLHAARRADANVAVAVAREERARLRVAARGGGALRDLASAALRYRDPQDRVRVLYRLAELLTARGDLPAAREALLAAQDAGTSAQRGHTVQRLRTVARALGDELELRRSRGQGSGSLVTLAPAGARRRSAMLSSRTPRIRRLRDILTR
jgi:tetratricopeptide (TPR) repeat protein